MLGKRGKRGRPFTSSEFSQAEGREQEHFKCFVQNPLHSLIAELLGIMGEQLSWQDSELKNFAAVDSVDLVGFFVFVIPLWGRK